MKLNKKIELPEWLTAGIAFLYYWVMSLYKLTQAPIWQDESMEFYCSLTQRGPIRGITEYETMYERMAYIQQQPPLYNWIMALWLKVNEGEWWYRFSSVIAGFIAVIILYKLVKKLTSRFAATVSVFVFSSIYIIQYYIKEASEYMMLIMFLLLTTYIFFSLQEKISTGNIIAFTIVCVLDMLTHYGAAFVVVPMAVTVMVYLIKSKEWKALRTAIISFVIAGAGVGIPLLVFFVIPQSTNPVSTIGIDKPYEITGNNLLFDFFDSLMWVLRWCMLDYDRDVDKLTWAIWIILFVLIILGIVVYKKTKKKEIKYYIWCNVGVFFIYYVVTTLNMYAYGWFGNRYNLFILPLWFVLIVVLFHEFLCIMTRSDTQWMQKATPVAKAGILAAMILFCIYGDYRVSNHWDKSDLRTVSHAWYDNEGVETPTFVNFHQRYAFIYHMTHEKRYSEKSWEHLYCALDVETQDYNDEEWVEYLKEKVYPDGIPDKLYIVSGQHDMAVNALESIGYQATPIVDTTAKLFLLEKK